MSTQAIRLVIVTEKLLFNHLARIIDASGASGYTVTDADGQGSRGESSSKRPTVTANYEKMKVEVITTDEAVARAIADEVSTKYFDNFSGLIFMDRVEVLFAHAL